MQSREAMTNPESGSTSICHQHVLSHAPRPRLVRPGHPARTRSGPSLLTLHRKVQARRCGRNGHEPRVQGREKRMRWSRTIESEPSSRGFWHVIFQPTPEACAPRPPRAARPRAEPSLRTLHYQARAERARVSPGRPDFGLRWGTQRRAQAVFNPS